MRRFPRLLRPSLSVLSLLFLLVPLNIATAQIGKYAQGSGTNIDFEHDGLQRSYRLAVPAKLPEGKKVPVVVCLHGGGGDSRVSSSMGLTPLAEREGFVAVYPSALNKHWNDGRDSPMFQEHDRTVDDVSYVMAVLDQVKAKYPVDSNRVFAMGLSNGGFFAQKLAIEHSETFAAISVVIATMGKPLSETFQPTKPVSVLYMNGTEDPLMPYEGGAVGIRITPFRYRQMEAPRGRAISTDQAIALWAKYNGTQEKPSVAKTLPNQSPSDGSTIEYTLWDEGKQGTAVALYKVVGGGHAIPGGVQYLPVSVIGRPNQDAMGLELIWDFFQQHARSAE